MNVSCTQCQTVFRVDPAKVPVDGVRARCSVCSGVFWVRREAETTAPMAAAPAPAVASAPVRAAPAPPAPAPAPVAPPSPPVVAKPAAPWPPQPASPPPSAAPVPPAVPRPSMVPPSAPAAPSYRPASPPAPAFSPPPAARAPAPPSMPAPGAGGPFAQPAPAAPAVPRPKRPTNPFLSQDPEARARRLARALVSDIVVYHPAKRRDGLRDGSLKLLFEEEIRKSWDEYVDQVGKQLADSTTFFTDALNEILADGQPVFP